MRKLVLISLMVALLIVSMGCGKPEVEEDSYEDFVAEYYQTKMALHMLKNKHETLKADCDRLKGREAEYLNAVNTLTNENDALRIQVSLIEALGESQKGELESALNELASLKKEKRDWRNLAEKEYTRILAKYNAVLAVYPPSHFANKDVLVKWRANSGNITGSGACRELQHQALAEGHIVSLHPSFEYCTAVAGDYLYKITPEDKELVDKIRKVE